MKKIYGLFVPVYALAMAIALYPTTPAQAAALKTYTNVVSLGDSRAAGAGLPATSPSAPYDLACTRSSAATVNPLAYVLTSTPYNYACSGATTKNLWQPQTAINGSVVPSQLSQVPVAVLNNSTTLITLQSGPNDVGWIAWLIKCIQSTCGSTEDSFAIKGQIDTYKNDLRFGLATLGQLANKSTVLVGGVYDPFVGSQQLASAYGLTTAEYAWVKAAVSVMNTATSEAVTEFSSAYPVKYVAINLTNPYELQWINSHPAPFHPTVYGQSIIAQSFLPPSADSQPIIPSGISSTSTNHPRRNRPLLFHDPRRKAQIHFTHLCTRINRATTG
ncbi:hypothetical protein IPL68_01430 [Candidatus Saccharibacteria bacterium]|nr:MAG: hypothetical protein IPL68_01430 [Candidatus Saccharibacteria bacterium]